MVVVGDVVFIANVVVIADVVTADVVTADVVLLTSFRTSWI